HPSQVQCGRMVGYASDRSFDSLSRLRPTLTHPTTLPPSQIQHQPLGLAAGAADHDPLVLGLLFLAQNRIVVLGDAFYDALLAGAADTELAGIVDVDAFIEQDFEDGATLRNEEFLARARELDCEAALLGLGGFLFGREVLDVNLRVRPVLGGRLEGF